MDPVLPREKPQSRHSKLTVVLSSLHTLVLHCQNLEREINESLQLVGAARRVPEMGSHSYLEELQLGLDFPCIDWSFAPSLSLPTFTVSSPHFHSILALLLSSAVHIALPSSFSSASPFLTKYPPLAKPAWNMFPVITAHDACVFCPFPPSMSPCPFRL